MKRLKKPSYFMIALFAAASMGAGEIPEYLVEDSPFIVSDEGLSDSKSHFSDTHWNFETHLQSLNSKALSRGFYSGHQDVSLVGITLNDPWSPHREVAIQNISSQGLGFQKDSPFSSHLNWEKALPNQSSEKSQQWALSWGIPKQGEAFYSFRSQKTHLSMTLRQDKSLSDAHSLQEELEADQKLHSQIIFETLFRNQSSLAILGIFQKSDLDRQGGPRGDDPNFVGESQLIGLSWKSVQTPSPFAQVAYKFSHSRHLNLPDSQNSNLLKDDFRSHTATGTFHYSVMKDSVFQMTVKLKTELEAGEGSENLDTNNSFFTSTVSQTVNPYLITQWENLETIQQVEIGFSTFQPMRTENPHLSLLAKYFIQQSLNSNLEWAFQLSQNSRSPSLYQLHSSFGNPHLKSETDQEVSLQLQHHSSALNSSKVEFFYRKISNLIDYDFSQNLYLNLSSAWVFGGAWTAQHSFHSSLLGKISYQYLHTRDTQSGLALLRRPEQSLFIESIHQSKWVKSLCRLRYQGSRDDLDPDTFTRIRLKAFWTVDLLFSKSLDSNRSLEVLFSNLFDKTFEEVAGYQTRGFFTQLTFKGHF